MAMSACALEHPGRWPAAAAPLAGLLTRAVVAGRAARASAALALGGLLLAVAPLVTAQQAARQSAAEPARRIALVVGNNGYDSAPLANSINDAHAMTQVLREAGFAVMLHTDIDQRQFQLALREFGERLKAAGSGSAGLFYYAGHGMQIKGRNFLIPVRSRIAHEDEVAYAAVDAQSVLDKMESAGNGTNIVILDACRNNPFARSWRSAQQGLAQMDAPVGTLIAYATAPGSVAIDSLPGLRNGLYTTHLVEAIRQPGLKVEDVLKQTRNAVRRASAQRQTPWEASALVGDFYFHPPRPVAAPSVPPASAPAAGRPAVDAEAAVDAAVEAALWDVVKDSHSSAELYAYLQRFPNGRHARQARQRLVELAASDQAPAATLPPPDAAPSFPGLPAAPTGAEPFVIRPAADAVEYAARWGLQPPAARAPQPRRNAAGFAEGDAFRYRKTDLGAAGAVTDYLWQVQRVEPDGSLWVNDGRQRLDALGQRHGGNDEHTGVWLELSPPLPLLELARRGAGVEQGWRTTVRMRDAAGLVEEAALRGTLRTSAEAVRGPRGTADLLPAIRIELALTGTSRRNDGVVRVLNWVHTYWMAPPLLLPVAFKIYEAADALARQNTLHELIAIDQMSLAEAAPAGAGR